MARVFMLVFVLALVGCSASPEGVAFDERTPSTPLEHAGQNSGGSSAGSSPLEAGSGGEGATGNSRSEGGSSSGASTLPVAGSGGSPTSTAGTNSGGAGQQSGGTGGSSEPNPYPSCGDGVCSQTDYGISGQSYVRPNTPACNSDCPQTCGNQKCEALQDMWNGCYEAECTPKPPEPILVCPFPEWTLPYNKDFVNPWHPGLKSWFLGDKVRSFNSCYECIDTDGCPTASPGSFPDVWKPVSCDC